MDEQLELRRYAGWYTMPGYTIEVRAIDTGLVVAFPGAPPGFEAPLHPLAAPHTFRLLGGPVDGATVVFQLTEAGTAGSVTVGGEYELTATDPPVPPTIPTGQGLIAPPLVLDAAKEAAFEALIAAILAADGALVSYELPYPKHEFLQYAAERDLFIFHGSGKPDIDEFLTRRTSTELRDRSGRGNVQGIYGTHDGLWPLFFAIVDRAKISGSIRNGFSVYSDQAGAEVRVYNFSINQEWLDRAPWRTGMLYFLPRAPFRRLPLTAEGSLSNEWVSETPLRPLARMVIDPADFPFLDQIGGHDDSQLLRFGELGERVLAAVVAAEEAGDVLQMQLAYTPELAAVLPEYIALAHDFYPSSGQTLRFLPGGAVWFDFAGPPAVMQVMRDQVAGKLSTPA